MTIALPQRIERSPIRFDLSKPTLYAFAALLCVLIVLPMSWLVYFSLIDEAGRKKILLNFSKVEYLSSAALGKLITLDKKVKAKAGRLKLCSPALPLNGGSAMVAVL